MIAVAIKPPVLEWAQRRSGRDDEAIRGKFQKWDRWLSEEQHPSFSDVERIATYTRVPVGYLLLAEPPEERLPIPDFRIGRGHVEAPSDDLLETIYVNQRRQAWYEDYLADYGGTEALAFVGSARNMIVDEAAASISEVLDYGIDGRSRLRSVDEARAHLIWAFEDLGGLVVLNSMVGNNTHRMLDLVEFRGFTLLSDTAPLVFVNARDTKRGQVFSILHEFAHVWSGDAGVSAGGEPLRGRDNQVERWCDAVAAQIAVPDEDLHTRFDDTIDLTEELDRLADRYRCSTLVVLIKLRELALIPSDGFSSIYEGEVERLLGFSKAKSTGDGGDFYNNQPFRVGETLSRAIIRDAKRGTTSMTEALRLLSFRRAPMLDTYAERLGEF